MLSLRGRLVRLLSPVTRNLVSEGRAREEQRTDLEIVGLVDVAMRREEVVHNHEMNLPPPRQLDPMQSVEARKERVRVLLDVLVVLLEDLAQELVLRVSDRLDDEPVIAREVEERPRLARGTEF